LAILLPLLEEMNNFMKMAHIWDVLVVNYVATIKLCQAKYFSHFVNFDIAFKF
jgi:hypothetical protein